MGVHKEGTETLPGLAAPLAFPLPSSWSLTTTIHGVPSMALQLQILTPTQRAPNKTSSILPISLKANPPTAASVPDLLQLCLFVCLYIPAPGWKPQDAPTPNCQGGETSVRKLLGEPRRQQLAHSPTKLQKCLGQEL